jgi:fibronectin-binding autotransporter adhesin
MKMSSTRILAAFAALLSLCPLSTAHAASATWNGTTDSLWATDTNWSATPVPGVDDIATFNNAGNGNTNITVGTISLGTTLATGNAIIFDTANAAAYTLSGGTITVGDGTRRAVNMTSTTGNDETISANFTLGTAATSNTTFQNDSLTGLLTLSGNITGGTGGTAGFKTLTITGTGNTVLSGTASKGGATSLNLVKTGSGTLEITSSNNGFFSGNGNASSVTGGVLITSGVNSVGALSNLQASTIKFNNASNGGLTAGPSVQVVTSVTFQSLLPNMQISNPFYLNTAGANAIISGANSIKFTGAVPSQSVAIFGVSNGTKTITSSLDSGKVFEISGDFGINSTAAATGGTMILAGTGDTIISGQIYDYITTVFAKGNLALPTGVGTLNITNTGTTTLSATSSYTAKTTLGASSTVAVSTLADGGSASSVGASSNAAANLTITNATLKYTGGATSTDRGFTIGAGAGATATLDASGTGAVNFTNTASPAYAGAADEAKTLILTGANTGNNTLAANIADSGAAVSVTKNGTGTWILSGANTYTGATTVSNGTLFANGSLAVGSAVSVSAGGTLGGTGTVNGATTIAGAATLQGGDGATASDDLALAGNVSLADGAIIKLALGAPGAHSSLTRTGGTWSFDLDQAVTFADLGAAAGVYDNIIAGLTGSETGLASIATWTITNSDWAGTFSYDGSGGVDLTLAAVPEPSTWAMLVGGFGMLLGFQRSRRRMAS